METVKVSSKGQIVIPKSLRDAQRIQTGDQFIVTSVDGELRFKPAFASGKVTLKSVAGMLHGAGVQQLSDDEIERRISKELHGQDAASKTR
jgi:AbrB family looped-hinge helix DNA binding protein